MRWLAAVALCAGCYRPGADPACAIACIEGAPDNCPSGLDCIAGLCRGANSSCPDDAMPPNDADPVDSSISTTDAGFCVGSNMPLQVCLTGTPMNSTTIMARTTIDTTNCTSVLQHQGRSLCVYAYNTLTVMQTLHFVGTRAPVIVAMNVTIVGGGRISVAHELGSPGAGSNPSECPSLSPGMNGTEGAGGGAGGSFGSNGGDGGNGQDGNAIGALHAPAANGPYTSLRGGCSGSMGGSEPNRGVGGEGGAGGGAIAILASDTITINGAVLAYGDGGGGAMGAYAGGGGGGAGGMIVLDAPILSGSGWVGANGGGGGGGGTNIVGALDGGTSLAASPQAGGSGGTSGVNGGVGGVGGAVANASNGAGAMHGAGGGGGGGGVVLVRGSETGSLDIYPRR